MKNNPRDKGPFLADSTWSGDNVRLRFKDSKEAMKFQNEMNEGIIKLKERIVDEFERTDKKRNGC